MPKKTLFKKNMDYLASLLGSDALCAEDFQYVTQGIIRKDMDSMYALACFHLFFGNKRRAEEWAQRAVNAGSISAKVLLEHIKNGEDMHTIDLEHIDVWAEGWIAGHMDSDYKNQNPQTVS